MSKNNFSLNVGVNFISITYFNHGSGNQNALRPRGPTPVSHAFPAGKAVRKGCKRTVVNAVRSLWHWHFGSGMMEPQTNPFGETPKNSLPHGAQTIWALVFSGRAGVALPALPLKIPSRATQ